MVNHFVKAISLLLKLKTDRTTFIKRKRGDIDAKYIERGKE